MSAEKKHTSLRGAVIGAALALLSWSGPAPAQTVKTPPVIENYNIGEAYVRALANDPHRNSMWVGTSVGALEIDLARQTVKNSFTRKDGLANEYVFAVGVGPDAKVWFGTNAGGVSTYDKDGKWKTYFPMHGLADYWVYSFAFDKAGGVWIGTWDGANYVEPKTLAFKSYKQELINIWVYGLDVDPQGRVWFGTEGGVSMFDGKAWKSWTSKDGLGAKNVADLPRSANTGLGTRTRQDLMTTAGEKESYNPDYVFAALWDKTRDAMWFGTWGGGASLFDGKTWKSFSTNEGLAGNIVYSIVQDRDGSLWFGTNHGVSHYDGKNFTNYTKADGLLGDNVYALAIDPQGAVWMGTKGGVSRLVKRKS